MQAACVALLFALLAPAYAARPIPFSSRRFQTRAQLPDGVQRTLKCSSSPSRATTLCFLVSGQNENITGDDVRKRCHDIGMKLLSSETTPKEKVCELARTYHLKPMRIWWTDRLNQTHLGPFDFCWDKEKAKKTASDQAIVCQKSFFYSDFRTCVTFQEGPDDVKYCFFDERVQAVESKAKCTERSSHLLDPSQLHGTEMLEYARNLVRTPLVFWIDITGDDMGYEVGSFTDSVSYAIRCNTVRFGPTDPSFWKSGCSGPFPIICELETSLTESHSSYVNDTECAYRQSNSGTFSYCIAKDQWFSLSAGREFCKERGLVLLRDSTLRKVHGLYDLSLTEDPYRMDEFRIWEAGFDAEGNTKPGYCTATNLINMVPEKQSLPCSHQLGYICRQRVLPECGRTGREHLSFAPGEKTTVNMPQMCISQDYITYQDSVEYCKQRNMTLLSEQILSGEEEKLLLKQYPGHRIWVVPTGGGVAKYASLCKNGVMQKDADCSQRHRAVCTSGNLKEPTETTGPLPKCYGCQDPRLGRTNLSRSFSNAFDKIRYFPDFLRNYYFDNEFWPALSNLTDTVRSPDDFEALPYLLAKSLESFNKYVLCRDEEDQKEYNKKFGHMLVDIVENTMLKSKILQAIDEDRRILTASCLFNIVEDIAMQKNLTRSR